MARHDDTAILRAHLCAVDQAAREAEAKWGFDRLPTLVSVATRAKFELQRKSWSAKMEAAWEDQYGVPAIIDAAVKSSEATVRAWQALDAEATASGRSPIEPDVWEFVLLNGDLAAFVRTAAEASAVTREGGYAEVWTLNEVANAIAFVKADKRPEVVREPAVKADGSWTLNGDAIPFGDGYAGEVAA